MARERARGGAGWALIAAAGLAGLLAYAVLYGVASAVARRRPGMLFLEGSLLRHSRGSLRVLLPLVGVRIALRSADAHLPPEAAGPLLAALNFGLVVAATWLGIRLTRVMEDVAGRRFAMDAEDNLHARRMHTRVALLRRVLVVGIGVVGLGMILLQMPGFRAMGTGLLASAGVLGVIVGVAAQRPIANLLAGLQIAVTQPIRVEDAVIVEGEWGWVEEITLTYVVVRLWDLRRLVLPIGYFLEKPFQNWTRTTASLLGSAYLHADYAVPVDAVRAELERIVRTSPLWDGRTCVLQVTDLTERSVQLRALVSAANAGRSWDLQCEVREKLIAFLQLHHPDALPRVRLEPARVEF
jgi:small-conductance mechanosensitive channel